MVARRSSAEPSRLHPPLSAALPDDEVLTRRSANSLNPHYLANLQQQQLLLQFASQYEQQQSVLRGLPTVACVLAQPLCLPDTRGRENSPLAYSTDPSPRVITPLSARAAVRASPYRRTSIGTRIVRACGTLASLMLRCSRPPTD